MYALFDALALASFLILSWLYTRDDLPVTQRRLLWVGWGLTCALLWYTLYLGFIIVAAELLYALVMRRDGLTRSLVAAGAAFVVWSTQLATFLYQLPHGGLAFPGYAHHQLAALYELIGQSTIAVQTHGAAYFVAWTSAIGWAWLLAACIVALPGNARSLCLWLGAPAALTLVYGTVAHKLLYTDRYYLLLAYALCALTGIAVVRLAQGSQLGALPGWVAAVALAVLGAMYAFAPAYYTADWPAVGDLLRARMQSGDLVVFEQGSPFFVLARGDALGRHPLMLVFSRREIEGTLRLAQPYHRVWLVLFQTGPVDSDAKLMQGLAKRYSPAGYWEFFRRLPAEGVSIVLFKR